MSKSKVWDLINKKKKKIQEGRKRQFRGPYSIVCEFINNMDDTLEQSKTADEFFISVQTHINTLNRRMKYIDPEVEMKVEWSNGQNMDEDVERKKLRVDGVRITWSRFYMKQNPLNDPEKYIDVADLFLKGYFTGEKE